MRRFDPLVAALLVVLTAAPAGAQVSAPSVSRVRLANGLTVLVRENPTAPVVARTYSAVRIPENVNMPAAMSAMDTPVRATSSGEPVTDSKPASACTNRS